jgi:hypothetical protein
LRERMRLEQEVPPEFFVGWSNGNLIPLSP